MQGTVLEGAVELLEEMRMHQTPGVNRGCPRHGGGMDAPTLSSDFLELGCAVSSCRSNTAGAELALWREA